MDPCWLGLEGVKRTPNEDTMEFYSAQDIYRKLNHPGLRLAAVKTVRALRKRHLLVRIDTNDACNLRCVMCYFSDPNRKPMARPMSIEMFESIAEQVFPRSRYLYLSCGAEPFVTTYFDKLLDITGPYQVPFISYCTNGLLMKDKFIEATLRNRVSEVIVSVDGGTKETYEKIRVGGSWHTLNERLAAFCEARKAHQGPVPILRFNFTVQEGNCHELREFVAWAQQWSPETVQLRLFRSLDGALKQHDDLGTVEALMSALPELRKQATEAGFRLLTMDTPDERRDRIGADGSPFSGGLAAVDLADTKANPVNCQLPWFNLYITPEGGVRPCTVYEPVGNLLTSTFADIEKGEAMTRLRKNLSKNPEDVCIKCQLTGASGV